MPQARHQSAFTLVEMLVATMVFVIGFVAVYSLFIAGMNYRHEADRLTKTALAASSLISTWRLEMQDQWDTIDQFVGDGNPAYGPENNDFFPYSDDPGIWYRIEKASNAAGETGLNTDTSSTIRIELLLIDLGDTPASMDLTQIKQRFRVNDTNYLITYADTIEDAAERSKYIALASDDEKAIYVLVQRKILARHEAVILRR